jgi:ABC-type sugar transport system substrate-binding protein
MKKSKALLGIAVTAGIALALTGCNRDGGGDAASTDDGAITVGVVVKTLSNPVWQGVVEGAQAAADELGGVTIETAAGTSEQDITGQINKIQDMISAGVDALAVAPNGDAQLQPILQQAVDKGIPVVMIDTDIPSFSGKSSHVTSDQDTSATEVNEQIVDVLGDAAKGAEVGILDYPGNTTVQARVDAATKVFEDAGMKIVSTLPGNCDRATALNSATDMLTANPDIKAIFGGCGQGATGAAQAVQNAGKDVLVTGFDGINDEFKDIEAGSMLATILQDFPAIGEQAVKAVVAAKKGDTVDQQYLIPGILITKDTVGDYTPAG